MKILPHKFSYKLTIHEMEDLIHIIEQKIKEPMPLYDRGFAPIERLTFNYLVKAHLIELRKKLINQYESTRSVRFKVNINFLHANAFLAAFRFDKAGIAWKINSEIHPKII